MTISLEEFADRIASIMPAVVKEFMRRNACEIYEGKVTLPQLLIMNYLNQNGESKMSDLARFMNVTTPATTGIVNRLVKCGYVRRVYDPDDRRIIKVRLMSKGLKLIKKINERRRRFVMDIFSRIPDADRQSYLGVLTRVHQMLMAEKGEG